jgi:hypothetical protein
MPDEPNEDLETRDRELAQAAAQRSSGIARVSDADDPDAGAPSSGDAGESSTGAGNPVAGREISEDEAAEARARSEDAEG